MSSVTIDPPGGGNPNAGSAAVAPAPSTPVSDHDTLGPPANPKGRMSRAGSIVISPRHRPTARGVGGGGISSDLDKLSRLDALSLPPAAVAPSAPAADAEPRCFDKTLASEVSNDEAVALLQRMDEQCSLFREFTFSDLAYLATVLTILKFDPGDTIIEAGEEASFVGIVLQGTLEVSFGATKKPIPEFELLGELSFFDGGTRTAAVSAKSHAVLGMITHNELIQLADYAPTIRLKLMVMFALEGIKKMRQFSAGGSGSGGGNGGGATGSNAGASGGAASDAQDAANTPYNKSASNKRASTVMGAMVIPSAIAEAAASASAAAAAEGAPGGERSGGSGSGSARSSGSARNSATGTAGHERTRSLRRVASIVRDSVSFANALGAPVVPGSGGDNGAAANRSTLAGGAAPLLQPRNVEALFRIRMKASEKTQQEKIEKALEKRKKAEHKASSASVIADGFRRELDKKQEFIEELYQENVDLREYKAWAQRKHISDARFLKEKLENFAELQTQLSDETQRRRAQEQQTVSLSVTHQVEVATMRQAHEAQVASLESELRRAAARIETGEKAVASLTESLRIAKNRAQLDEARIAEGVKHTEEVRVEQACLANEQVALHQRALHVAQDELAATRKSLRESEEKVAALSAWQEGAIETQQHRDMLHARLHRHLVDTVDRHAALSSDVERYRTVLKYVLASALVKNFRRRRALRGLVREHVDLTRKLSAEVAHHVAGGGAAAAAAQVRSPRGASLRTLPSAAGGAFPAMQSHAVTTAIQPLQTLEDNDDEEETDADYDPDAGDLADGGNGGNGSGSARRSGTHNHKRGQSRLIGLFHASGIGLGGGLGGSGGVPKPWILTAKPEALFQRLFDLAALLRTLTDDMAAQKIYWHSTADSFFRRTIELKQSVMDLEQRGGSSAGAGTAAAASSKHHSDALAAHAAGSPSTAALAHVHESKEQSDYKEDGLDPARGSTIAYSRRTLYAHNHGAKIAASVSSPRSSSNPSAGNAGANGPGTKRSGGASDDSATASAPTEDEGLSVTDRLYGSHSCRRRSCCTARDESLNAANTANGKDASTGAGGGGSGGVVDVKELRDKVASYKRRTKEYRESNAALSLKAQALAERVRDVEQWQRQVVHHSMLTGAPLPPPMPMPMLPASMAMQGPGLHFGSLSPPPPPMHHAPQPLPPASLVAPLPPVAAASPSNASGGSFRLNNAPVLFSSPSQQQQPQQHPNYQQHAITPVHRKASSGVYGARVNASLLDSNGSGLNEPSRTPNPLASSQTHLRSPPTANFVIQPGHTPSGHAAHPPQPLYLPPHPAALVGSTSKRQSAAFSNGGPSPLLVFPPSSSSSSASASTSASSSHHAHAHSWAPGLSAGRGGVLANQQQASLTARAHFY